MKISNYKFLIASIFISLFSVISLLKPGLPPTHDGEFHVLRFEQFFKSINEGTLYPRWAQDFNNGYGIPLFNYVYPLPNYVAAFTHLLGFSFIESLKLNMIFATIIGSIFFYLWTKKFWGEWGALVSTVFYAYSPYHLLDIYVRGSVGEVWSLGLAPILLWGYQSYFESRKIKYFVFSSFSMALIVLAHNILAVVFFAFFLSYAFFQSFIKKQNARNKLKEFSSAIFISVLGTGLSAIFWLPAILETKYVRGLQIFDPTQHFPVIYKLIYSSWGYGFSGINVPDQMSFQIGIANILVVIVCLLIFILKKRINIIGYFLFIFIFTVFLITPLSEFVWKNVPFVSYIQFPWRLLSVVILASSFLAGFIVSEKLIKSKHLRIIISISLIVFSIGFSINYIKAPFHHIRDDQYYLKRENFIYGTNSPGNVFNTLNFNAKLPTAKERVLSNSFKINPISSNVTKEKFILKGSREGEVLINIAHFPGWIVKIDGATVPAVITKDGIFKVRVPSGEHILEVVLKSTKLQTISLVITIFSALTLFCLFMWDKYIKIKK